MPENLNPEAVEAAAKAMYCEEPWSENPYSTERLRWEEVQEGYRQVFLEEAKTAVSAYLAAATTIEYAGKHKHAGIETVDEEGDQFESGDHVRENYADYPNCTPVYRLVTEWKELPEDME